MKGRAYGLAAGLVSFITWMTSQPTPKWREKVIRSIKRKEKNYHYAIGRETWEGDINWVDEKA